MGRYARRKRREMRHGQPPRCMDTKRREDWRRSGGIDTRKRRDDLCGDTKMRGRDRSAKTEGKTTSNAEFSPQEAYRDQATEERKETCTPGPPVTGVVAFTLHIFKASHLLS